ncbi:hypothetical protein AQZ50_14525 [Novosphingobium sp. Fuku2-ISO-50]|nr:hypothetical protein AQZ50_14525 [Novosphingobium sp. Fuku2-ISO-50]
MIEVLEQIVGGDRGDLAIDCSQFLARTGAFSRNRAADGSLKRITPARTKNHPTDPRAACAVLR